MFVDWSHIRQPIRARWMLHVKVVSKTTQMFGPKHILLETVGQESAAKSNFLFVQVKFSPCQRSIVVYLVRLIFSKCGLWMVFNVWLDLKAVPSLSVEQHGNNTALTVKQWCSASCWHWKYTFTWSHLHFNLVAVVRFSCMFLVNVVAAVVQPSTNDDDNNDDDDDDNKVISIHRNALFMWTHS